MTVIDFPVTSTSTPPIANVALLVRSAAVALGHLRFRYVQIAMDKRGDYGSAIVQADYKLAITVGVYSILRHRPPDEDIREWIARRDAAPRVIAVELHADVEWLAVPARYHVLKVEGPFGGEHVCPEFQTVEDAVGWVRAFCHREPVPRFSTLELAAWSDATVELYDQNDQKTVEMTLFSAARIFAKAYGRKVDAATLTKNHRVSALDAKRIVHVVRRVLGS